MESEQKYIKKQNKRLRDIVKDIFSVDVIKENNRIRSVVDAKRAYTKILRDEGYSYQEIAKILKKNHATLIHYMRSVDTIIKSDPIFNKKYILCKKRFIIGCDDENKKEVNRFVDYMQLYYEENKKMPSIEYCKNVILKYFK